MNTVEGYFEKSARTKGLAREFIAFRQSRLLGIQVKEGVITKDENDRKLEEVLEWAFRGGECPAWIQDPNERREPPPQQRRAVHTNQELAAPPERRPQRPEKPASGEEVQF